MSKQAFELLDLESGFKYALETAVDVLPSDFTLVLPERNGTLALTKDIDDLSGKLVRGDVVVGDSKKLDGKSLSEIALSDMSNVTLTPEIISSLRGYTGSAGSTGANGLQGNTGYTGSAGVNGIQGIQGLTGYTGSKGATGQGFSISAIFNSLAELLAGTTTDDTFALVAGTLSPDADDYGKLYHRFNNTWTYITDMSVKGAAGITGPQGNVGYTGSVGAQGTSGYTGSKGDTGPMGPQGPAGTNANITIEQTIIPESTNAISSGAVFLALGDIETALDVINGEVV